VVILYQGEKMKKLWSVSGAVALLSAVMPDTSVFAATGVDADNDLEEVVVTAERRESTVQDTAISMTAISGNALEAHGAQTVEDLIGVVPGVSARSAGPGQTEYEMRGLGSSGGSTATVGFYLDDTPLTASAISFNGRTVIDPDLFDLDHAEVLRGPQGTLYGAGSMGGTIRLVTNQPKLGQFEGATSDTVSQTADGGRTNGGGNLMFNIPIGDVAALRVVVTDKYNSGWIDRKVVEDPATGVFPFPTNFGGCGTNFCTRGNVADATVLQTITGSNLERDTSARAALLVKPTDELSITASGMYQRINMDGFDAYQYPPGASQLSIYQPYDIEEPYHDTFKLASLKINYNLGVAELTSSTSYTQRSMDMHQDSTEALQNTFNLTSFIAAPYTEADQTTQFAEELRVASTSTGAIRWVSGIFISNLHSGYQTINQNPAFANAMSCPQPNSGSDCPAGLAYNPNVGGPGANPQGIVYDANSPNTTRQQAIFGEISAQLEPKLTLTAGVRLFRFTVQNRTFESGLGSPTGNATPTTGTASGSGSGVLPKVNLSYQPTEDLNIYGTISRGSRPGGVNQVVPLTPGAPAYCGPGSGPEFVTVQPSYFGPDDVWSFELGEKARFDDRRIVVNADVFYVNWQRIQQPRDLSCGYAVQTNAGDAKSYGPELEVSAKIVQGLTADLSGAYTQAFISDPTAASGIMPGTRILNVPKYTGSLAFTYEKMLTGQLHGTARISGSYVGSANDISYFPTTLPPYALVDARVGVGQKAWTTYLFISNLTDRHAGLTTNTTVFAWPVADITRFTTNQPRTIGVELTAKF
jgi:iron complex outermembrane recepter protein